MTLKMVLFVRLKPMRLGPPTEEGTLVPFNENYLIGVQSVVIDALIAYGFSTWGRLPRTARR